MLHSVAGEAIAAAFFGCLAENPSQEPSTMVTVSINYDL